LPGAIQSDDLSEQNNESFADGLTYLEVDPGKSSEANLHLPLLI
jgi:hypothetical protein